MQPSAIKYEPYMPLGNGFSPPMTALAGIDEIRVPVESDTDIVAARQKGRALAARLGFSSGEATMVATAISELARNIVLYADRGEIIFGLESNGEESDPGHHGPRRRRGDRRCPAGAAGRLLDLGAARRGPARRQAADGRVRDLVHRGPRDRGCRQEMEAVTGPTPALQEQFTKALETHLTQGGEAALLSAYELGRTVLNERLGVLDVATLLQGALVAACQRRPRESVRTVQAAGSFVLECLCSFEMAHRAVREANTALRGLNEFLEEQTRRISHELHDEAGQLLASVYLALDDVARDLPAPAAARLQSVKTLLDRDRGGAAPPVARPAPHDPRRSRADGGARRSRRGCLRADRALGQGGRPAGRPPFLPRSRPSCTASSRRRSTT